MEYKPALKELTQEQQEAVDRYAIVTDTDVGRLIREHIQTEFVNKMLFGKEPLDMNDQYFRGMLQGMEVFMDYIHERAELQRSLPQQ